MINNQWRKAERVNGTYLTTFGKMLCHLWNRRDHHVLDCVMLEEKGRRRGDQVRLDLMPTSDTPFLTSSGNTNSGILVIVPRLCVW